MIVILPCSVNLKFTFHEQVVVIVARLHTLMQEANNPIAQHGDSWA